MKRMLSLVVLTLGTSALANCWVAGRTTTRWCDQCNNSQRFSVKTYGVLYACSDGSQYEDTTGSSIGACGSC